jgi:hypothetical protein
MLYWGVCWWAKKDNALDLWLDFWGPLFLVLAVVSWLSLLVWRLIWLERDERLAAVERTRKWERENWEFDNLRGVATREAQTDFTQADIDAAAWQLLSFYYKGEEWSRKAWTARGLSKELWDQVNALFQKRSIRRGRKAQLEPKTMAHAWGLWCEAKLKNRTLYRHGDHFVEGG